MGDVGVGAEKVELGVYIVPVVVVAVVGAESAVPPVSVVMIVVSGAHSFKNAFAGVMVAVDNLGVDEPTESWLVGVDGLFGCVAPCGCGWVTGTAATTGGGGGGGGEGSWN